MYRAFHELVQMFVIFNKANALAISFWHEKCGTAPLRGLLHWRDDVACQEVVYDLLCRGLVCQRCPTGCVHREWAYPRAHVDVHGFFMIHRRLRQRIAEDVRELLQHPCLEVVRVDCGCHAFDTC